MKATMSQMFDYYPGNHGLTEDIIYNFQPTSDDDRISIFSGSKNNIVPIGFIRKEAKNKSGKKLKYFEGDCLILTKDGSAGLITYKEKGTFTINHHACVLKVKNEWKDKLDQEWFAYQYKTGLYQYVTSKSDNRIFSTEWFDRVLFEIPDYEVQLKQKFKKKKISIIADNLNQLKSNLEQIMIKNIIDLNKGDISVLKDIFKFKGGNSGLTEEFIYHNQPINDEEKIPILSGATLKTNLMGHISRMAMPNKKPLRTFKGPCILVTRNGVYAGTMSYIESGEFTTNDHAYVMSTKKKWERDINLRWFIYQYQNLFYNLVTSKSDNATFNKEYTKKQIIKIPNKEKYQDVIAEKLNGIDKILDTLDIMDEKIKNIIDYEVI